MKEKLTEWINLLTFLPEEDVMGFIIDYVYSNKKENTLDLFLKIQELDRLRVKEENNLLYRGLEESMSNFGIIARHLVEDKTSRQAKDTTNHLCLGDNLASLIRSCMAFFPDGERGGTARSTGWILLKLVDILKNHKEKYIEGGINYSWSCMMGYDNYIALIIEKHKL